MQRDSFQPKMSSSPYPGGRKSKGRVNGRKHDQRTPRAEGAEDDVPVLLVDDAVPRAAACLEQWLHQNRLTVPAAMRLAAAGKRFKGAMWGPGGHALLVGDDTLPPILEVVNYAATQVGISALALDTNLVEPEAQRVQEWYDYRFGAPGCADPVCPSDSGSVSVLHTPTSEMEPLSGMAMQRLLLRIRDALLSQCGINPPTQDPARGDAVANLVQAIAEDSGSVGLARVEHSVPALVPLNGTTVTTFAATYVMPLEQGSVLMHVTLMATSVDMKQYVNDFLISSTSIWWQGAPRAAMETMIAAIKSVVDEVAGPGEIVAEPFQGDMAVVRELVSEYVGRQIDDADERQQNQARIKALEQDLHSKSIALDHATAASKRVEKREADRVASLQANVEAARAKAEREGHQRVAAEKELQALKASRQVAKQQEPPAPRISERVLADLRQEAEHQRSLAEDYADELVALRQELHLVLAQRDAYAALLTPAAAGVVAYPSSLAELGGWANLQLGDRVAILPRALRAARKSAFRDPALVCRVLEALRDHYWPMRFEGNAKARAAWEEFLHIEHMRAGPVGDACTARQSRETYTVSWRGRRVTMDLHIQGHSGRDEVRQFRLYFLVDEETKTVVCGHLPWHLQNSKT